MKEKIEEIVSKSDIWYYYSDSDSNIGFERQQEAKNFLVNDLSTLIQEERKDAVEGFVEYLKLERKIFYAEPTLFALLEKASAEYLESEGEK